MYSGNVRYVTTEQLSLIAELLGDSGHSTNVWANAPPNVAARLLIRLVQGGMTDPIDLACELEFKVGGRREPVALLRSIRQLTDRGFSIHFGPERP